MTPQGQFEKGSCVSNTEGKQKKTKMLYRPFH